MKKLISMMIVFVMSFMSISAFAAYEAPVKLASVYNYGDNVYTIHYYGTNGGVIFLGGNVDIHKLPDSMYRVGGHIWRFCFYNDKIYFLAGEAESDDTLAYIYSCNVDGSGIRLLADNASNKSEVYIVDNVLYYDAYATEDSMNTYYYGYCGGIYSINLGDLSWKKIVSDNSKLAYCDGDYVYCGGQRAISVDGKRVIKVRRDCDEYSWDVFVKGNQAYYAGEGDVYVRDKNGENVRFIQKIQYARLLIDSVTDDKVYIVVVFGGYPPSAYVYEINR